MPSELNELVEAAIRYRRRGWSVIPISRKRKTPLVKWAEYQTRPPTEEQIRTWWKEFPDANIAVITGRISGLVVVDVDTQHGGNPKPIYQGYKTSLMQRTGSGGYHLFYEYPEEAEWVANQTGARPGVDVRGDGGYVVVAPSIHASGRAYEWVTEDEAGPQAPGWALRSKAPPSEAGVPQEPWLSEIMGGVPEGGRNDAMARLAGYFAGKGIPDDVTLQMVKLWNRGNQNPETLTEKEMRATVESVYRSAMTRTEVTIIDDEDLPQTPAQPKLKRNEFYLMRLNEFGRAFGAYSVEWDIENWLPSKTIGFIVSPPGTFKTWMTFDAAVSIATGTPFLGQYEVHNPGPVMIVQQEDFHGQTTERLAVILASKMRVNLHEEDKDKFTVPEIPDPPIYLHPFRRLRFDDIDVVKLFAKAIKEIRPRLVIIDPLYSAASVDNYMSKAAEQMFILKTLRDAYGTSFLVAHHTRKSSGDSIERMDAWGSQFLNAFLETGWQIRPGQAENAIQVKRHFKSAKPQPDLSVEFEIDTESEWQYLAAAGELSERMNDEIVDALATMQPIGLNQLAKHLGKHHQTVKRRLVKLMDENVVIQGLDNKYSLTNKQPSIQEEIK